MPLQQNPKHNKTNKAFIRNGIISNRKSSFGEPLRNYSFSNDDFKNVKAKIRNYKKKNKK